MGNISRTNNVVEGWHRKQSLTDVTIDNTLMRLKNETKQRTSFLNHRIRTLRARFNIMTPITFFEKMANLISL
ncbi:hypothetical protein HZS_6226 [Henneguya salminicola]|nr:hypothetical protein HZS_6226 [Henneguya salminicola]